MYKIKSLNEALLDFHQYGQYNVPIILKKYPELAPYMAADFVKSINGKLTWKNFIGSVVINRFIFLGHSSNGVNRLVVCFVDCLNDLLV